MSDAGGFLVGWSKLFCVCDYELRDGCNQCNVMD